MAFSYAVTTSIGATSVVTVPFPYLTRPHVHFYLDDVEVAFSTVTWTSDSVVDLGSVPGAGVKIRVARLTPGIVNLVVFLAGALNPFDLNYSVRQLLYLIQEYADILLERTVHGPVTDPPGLNYTLPSAAGRALRVLGFDAAGSITTLPASSFVAPSVISVQGLVTMVRTSLGTNDTVTPSTWVVFKPDGSLLDISGSQTQGLQEAINYCAENSWDLLVHGGTVLTSNSPMILCSVTVDFPPLELAHICIKDVSIISSAALGVRFDSMIATHIELCVGGQIVMSGANAQGVSFSPRTLCTVDHAFGKGIGGTCRVQVGSVVIPPGGTGICIVFDRSAGYIALANEFVFSELNGAASGIFLTDGNNAFTDNTIFGYAIHGQSDFCISVGQSVTHADLIRGNKWFVDLHPGTGCVALNTYGNGDHFHVTVNEGAFAAACGIKFESSAYDNIVDAPTLVAAALPVQDISSARSNMVRAQGFGYVEVDFEGSGPSNLVSGVWTKMAWSSLNYDTGGGHHDNWDAANFRWSPHITGPVRISAQICFTAAVDQALIRVGVYYNGALLMESFVACSGTGTQMVAISRDFMVLDTADYFEIWARQDSGSNKNVSGAVTDTWATFARI